MNRCWFTTAANIKHLGVALETHNRPQVATATSPSTAATEGSQCLGVADVAMELSKADCRYLLSKMNLWVGGTPNHPIKRYKKYISSNTPSMLGGPLFWDFEKPPYVDMNHELRLRDW